MNTDTMGRSESTFKPVPTLPRPLVQDTVEEEDTMNTDTMDRSESTF
jgi:hypothetical protein